MADPAPQPENTASTALVLSKASGVVAHRINWAISPDMLSSGRVIDQTGTGNVITATHLEPDYSAKWPQLSNYMNVLFFALCLVAVVQFLWEAVSTVIDAGTSEQVEDRVHKLLNPEVMKKGLRLLLFMSLGGAMWAYIYGGVNTLRVAGINIVGDAKNTAKPFVNLMDPVKLIAPADPAVADSSIVGTISKASNTLGAWHFARVASERTAALQAANAADVYWNTLYPNGETTSSSAPGAGDKADDLNAGSFQQLANLLISYGTSLIMFVMNFGLDVMIVRSLVFNAIYLMIAYKVAILVLPLALVAAYWHQWDGVLRGVIQIIIVSVISLNVLKDVTAVVVSPTQVQAIIQDASAQSQAQGAQAEMMSYAKKVYAAMTANGAKQITKESYKTQVVNELGNTSNAYMFNIDASFWAPIRVFLLLTIMVTLISKIGIVVSDTLSGSMSYHRG